MKDLQISDLVSIYSDPKTTPKFQKYIASHKEFSTLSSKLVEPLPEAGEYFKYQELINRYLQHYDKLFLRWDPGVGKTCAVVASMEWWHRQVEKGGYIKRAIVVVKSNLLQDEFRRQIVCRCTDKLYLNIGDDADTNAKIKTRVNRNLDTWWGITNLETFTNRLSEKTDEQITELYSNTAIIVDEAHNLSISEGPSVDILRELEISQAQENLPGILSEYEGEDGESTDESVYSPKKVRISRGNIKSIKETKGKGEEKEEKEEKKKGKGRGSGKVSGRGRGRGKGRGSGKVSGKETGKGRGRGKAKRADEYDEREEEEEEEIIIDDSPSSREDVEKVYDALQNTNKKTKRSIYESMSRLITLTRSTKIMFLSATPMINDSNEIVSVINLLLDSKDRIEGDVDKMSDEELMEKFKGLISRVRQNITGVDIEREGTILPVTFHYRGRDIKSKFPVVMVPMSKRQKKSYELALKDPRNFTGVGKSSNAVHILEQHISNFLYPSTEEFPNGMVGNPGFKKFVTGKGNLYTPTEKFKKDLKNKLGEMSSTFQRLIDNSIDKKGIDWIFCNFDMSGAVTLSLALKERGIELFTGSSSAFEKISGNPSYCNDATGLGRKMTIKPKKRMAILRTSVTKEERMNIMELLNSPENRHGEYIKYIIGTPMTRDGINIYSVARIHYYSNWNRTSNHQGEGRALRVTGFKYLLDELKALGKEDSRIKVNIYAYAAVTNTKIKSIHVNLDEEEISPSMFDTGSIELDMFLVSEAKDIKIKRIERLMDRAAIDCPLHNDRNKIEDEDYSPACNYDKCDYICMDYDEPINEEIRSEFGTEKQNYLNLYSNIKPLQVLIKNIFSWIYEIKLSDLYTKLDSYETRFIDMALLDMIYNKIPIINRFGMPYYLEIDHSRVFISPGFTTSQPSSIVPATYYSKSLVVTRKGTIDEYIKNARIPEQTKLIDQLRTSTDEDEVERILGLLLDDQIVSLFEEIITRYYTEEEDAPIIPSEIWEKYIYDKYSKYLYEFREPLRQLNIYTNYLLNRPNKRGRPVKNKDVLSMKDVAKMDFVEDDDTPIVIVHVLKQRLIESRLEVKFAETARFKRNDENLRIFKPSEYTPDELDSLITGFRNPNNVEKPAYAIMVHNAIIKSMERFQKQDIYGTIIGGKAFRIVDQRGGKNKSKDSRQHSRGQVCTTINLFILIGMLKHLKVPHNDSDRKIAIPDNVKSILSRSLTSNSSDIERFSAKDAEYYYRWLNYKRGELCKILQDTLTERDLVFIE